MQPSPYTPGETAREVPGREPQLTDIAGMLARVALDGRFAGRIRADIGPRGVGKTSLLRRAQRTATDMGLATVFVTAGNGTLTVDIADEIQLLDRSWGQGDLLVEHVTGVKVSAGVPGFSVEVTAGNRDHSPGATRAFRELVVRTARAAVEEGGRRGLVLLVDEFQASDTDSLRTIAYAWQELQSHQPPVPAAFLAAGLSHTPDVVTGAVTHSERFQYKVLQDLEPPQAREALTSPSADLGVTWATDAMESVIEHAQGYPFVLQLYGDEVWRAARHPDAGATLTMEHVAAAQATVDVDLTELYRTRWAKATPRERELLAAMAEHPGAVVPRRDVAEALGVESTALSMARQALMDKGIVHSPSHGTLAFTVPGFGRYVRALASE